jgi:hypothetical protein
MPNFTQAELNTEVTAIVSGSFTAANFLTVANRAVREVLSALDLRSMIRKAALSPNLFDDVFQYTCPTDLKSDKVIDIKPQIDRGRHDYWRLTTPEEFDRVKDDKRVDQWGDPIEISKRTQWLGESLIAISSRDFVRKLLLSRPIDDDSVAISTLDSVGDWVLFGDGENLTADSANYVKGSASINWDISSAGGTTAGIQNPSLDEFDVTDYLTEGSVFVWAYLSSKTNVTNFIIRIGSGASAYYSITITTNSEGTAFVAGWNLLRFDFTNKSTTGTPDDDACDYVVLYMTKDSAKVSETDYRFDNIVMKKGNHYDVIYYSKYGWQSSTGTYLEDATATTDLLNCDTDEYNLVIEKTAQFMEEHLKNLGEADKHEVRYMRKEGRYVMDNPSQALLLIQTYYTL